MLALYLGVLPLALFNTVVLLILAAKRVYRERRAALLHAKVASIPALSVGLFAWVELFREKPEMLVFVGMHLAVVLALAWLPLAIHHLQSRT